MSDSDVTISFSADTSDLLEGFSAISDNAEQLQGKLGSLFKEADQNNWQASTQSMANDFTSMSQIVQQSAAQNQQNLTTIYNSGARLQLDAETQKFAALGAIYANDSRAQIQNNDQTQQTQKAAISGEIAALHAGLTEKRMIFAEESKLKLISAGQRVELTKSAAEQEYQVEKSLLERQLVLGDQEVGNKQLVLNKLAMLEQKHVTDMEKLQFQGAEASVGAWQSAFQRISSSLSHSMMGMIQGTTTLRDAMRQVSTNILQYFVQSGFRLIADWATSVAARVALTQAGQTQETAAVATGTMARNQLESSSATASVAAKLGTVVKSIMSSSAETFAGVFGFMSPMLGPAAAGPAAASQASVASMASLASFDIGAWSIPSDRLAMVHQNELVMPAAEAGAFRQFLTNMAQSNGSGSSGRSVHLNPSLNLNVQAMDGSSVASTLSNNRSDVMKSLEQMVRQGAHLGLRGLTRD